MTRRSILSVRWTADLRGVKEMQRELRAHGQNTSFSVELYKRACSPGANVGAVWFMVSILKMMGMFGMLGPWIRVLADAGVPSWRNVSDEGSASQKPATAAPSVELVSYIGW